MDIDIKTCGRSEFKQYDGAEFKISTKNVKAIIWQCYQAHFDVGSALVFYRKTQECYARIFKSDNKL